LRWFLVGIRLGGLLGGDAVAEGVREDLADIEAEGVALGFSAQVGVDHIVLLLGRS
jgi:hypothetical protein